MGPLIVVSDIHLTVEQLKEKFPQPDDMTVPQLLGLSEERYNELLSLARKCADRLTASNERAVNLLLFMQALSREVPVLAANEYTFVILVAGSIVAGLEERRDSKIDIIRHVVKDIMKKKGDSNEPG